MFTPLKTFLAPKTAGNSIICLNIALQYQYQHPTKKICLFQVTSYPDIHLLAGISPQHSMKDLLPFYDTDEWKPHLLEKITQNQGVDILQSPSETHWSDITLSQFKAFFSLLQTRYDEVFIDLHQSSPLAIFKWILQQSSSLTLTSFVDPTSQQAVQNFLMSHPDLTNVSLIFNQCSQTVLNKISPKLPEHIKVLGTIPLSDTVSMWSQLYEGFPIMYQKKSKFKKAIEKIRLD